MGQACGRLRLALTAREAAARKTPSSDKKSTNSNGRSMISVGRACERKCASQLCCEHAAIASGDGVPSEAVVVVVVVAAPDVHIRSL